MNFIKKSFLVGLLALLVTGCNSSDDISKQSTAVQIDTKDIDGKEFNLYKSLDNAPVVLVFYRGGWCPYCNVQLRELQANVLPTVNKMGAKLVAISVDKPDEALKTKDQNTLGMILLSDSDAKILKDYKVDYKVPMELVNKYKNNYKIDIEKASGNKNHIIAIPAVYVIGQDKKIKFEYIDENYKVRAQTEDILKALKSLK
ncbi:MAG: Peroxiredoxin [uncultured Campylobacterales bacterium]|uniref:thioredoxin-dependent peroxiredoxin n=1 Tax=uncultured Campylobacterales bacterium TaxID=352960 RepID=A0A6S6T2I2_9BACT|nr:MAG: Peroxiredoxin [uncultured Campylobacterales bacterium]